MGHDYTSPEDSGRGGQRTELIRSVDTATGQSREISPITHGADETPLALRDSTFAKAGLKPVLKKQDKILRAKVEEESEIDILPSGEVYMSHVHVRRRLNEAFGPMGWALRPLGNVAFDPGTNVMYREWALVAFGRAVGTAFGSTKYQPKNARMDFADAAEAAKSNALTRICKDLGIGSECWDRQWSDGWKDRHAVHVWVSVLKNKKRGSEWEKVRETADMWRRVDAKPFQGEIEPVPDSPNQDRWRKQMKAWVALLEAEKKASREVANSLRDAHRAAAAAVKEADTAVKSERQAAPDPQIQQTEAGRSKPASAPVQHGPSNPQDRGYLIREAKIVKRDKDYILHKITMMDGAEYFTFSTTIYAEMQKHFARRDQIAIEKWETKRVGNATVRHIVDKGWRLLKQGSQQS